MTGAASAASGSDLLSIIQSLSLTTNLQLCLDAGDSASYSGSGQTWNDRSGGGYNFYLGADGSAGGTDPTFNGVAGRGTSSEYWSYNGGSYFTLAQSNPAWLQTFHKASAKFTLAEWVYINNITDPSQPGPGLGNNISPAPASGTGLQLGMSFNSLRATNVYISNAGATCYSRNSTAAMTNNAWNFLGISADFSTGVVVFNTNGTAETLTSQSLASPSSSSATATLQIAASGSNYGPEISGDRLANIALWDTAVSSADLTRLFTATRTKFGV